MSATTLAPQARQNVVLFSGSEFGGTRGVKKYKKVKEDGTSVLVLEGVAVFRSGVFRDSMGFQHTWEPIHMSQMVAHFDLLRSQNLFGDVPVRKGHGSFFGDPMDTLVGYHTGLKAEKRINPADSKEYTYLLADYEILDPDAQAKIDAGLWRNRSSEVGNWVTNDEAEFWPVYQGFAYVDIPAVEGLNFEKAGVGTRFALMSENDEEAPVGTENSGNGPDENQGASEDQNNGEATTSSGASETTVQVSPAEDQNPDEPNPQAGETDQNTGTENPANSAHSQPSGFRVFGKSVTDPNAVQSHIDSLEKFQGEQRDAGRVSFVSALVGDKKITAPQEEGMKALALSMSDEQFSQFKGVWEAAPTLSILESHTGGSTNHNGSSEKSAEEDRIEILEGTVKHHRQSGMSQEEIEVLPSYKELQQLQSNA